MHRRTVNICATVLSLVTLHSAVRISTKPHDHADKTLSVEVKMNSEKAQQTMYSGLSAPGATRKIKLSDKPKRRWSDKIHLEWPGDTLFEHRGAKSWSPKRDTSRTVEEIYNGQMKTEHLLANLEHYEVIVPVQVDEQGTAITSQIVPNHRRKRQVSWKEFISRNDNHTTNNYPAAVDENMELESNEVHYMLSAYGKLFHLNLTLSADFLAPNFAVEYRNKHNVSNVDASSVSKCHYKGHLRNTPNSRVIISDCLGLHGMFATEDQEYFVEPLWNMTGDMTASGHYHIVYKRSSFNRAHQDSHCGVSDQKYGNLPQWWLKSSSLQFQNEINKAKYPLKKGNRSMNWRRKRHKRSVSKEHYVETLVVVDKTMIAYHGKQEIEPYILTVMNIVANLFHDSSIGNSIHLLVTRLVLLTEDQPNLLITHHADKTLESFCKWQVAIKPSEGQDDKDKGIADHDNAILITRLDICTYKNEPCGTLGLAPVAGMCEPERSCSVNEDIGLASAFTISHELGHNFGMHHDGAGNRCGYRGYEAAKIMAAQLNKNTEPFSWSSCSMQYITDFLDSGRGACLENKPLARDFEYPVKHAGRSIDGHVQCKLQFGSWSKQCKFTDVCRELWCVGEDGECITNNIPPADGTTCSTNRLKKGWCYRGQCLRQGGAIKVVDGSWSSWSSWGHCTRTCGGGVESSLRRCNSPEPQHGGKYCIGERKRYKSCNTQDCPISSRDFRELQCQRFNSVPFRNKLYKWTPFDGGNMMKPCALNCLATGYNFYTERTPKVIDGTRCFPDSLDMCINGQCRHVGCDGVLGSETKEDKCRVCAGDGSSCYTVDGYLTEPLLGLEDSYREVARIPQGALTIEVNESVASRNYLGIVSNLSRLYFGSQNLPESALMSENGTYQINGAWTIDWPRKFHIADTYFHYERHHDGGEVLRALGPTSEALIVMVLLQEDNKGIYYKYNMPNAPTYASYSWEYSPWSPCSQTCGSGLMQSVAVCVQQDNNRSVRQEFCSHHVKPERRVRTCRNEACPAQWIMSEWSECSKSCGKGTQLRRVLCLGQINQDESEVLAQDNCPRNRPPTRKSCNKLECPPHWNVTEWSRCNVSCGPGQQTRRVTCVSWRGKPLGLKRCSKTEKPAVSIKCNNGQCPPPRWVTGSWGECTARCGKGLQYRRVECRTFSGKVAKNCKISEKPMNSQECDGLCVPEPGDPDCKDVNKISYCPLVMRFRFCDREYFRKMCCKTCSKPRG